MRNVRNSCFETNSSSSHSLVIINKPPEHYTPDEIREECWIDSDHTTLNYWGDDLFFGRSPFMVLATFQDKLRYAYANAPIRVYKNKTGKDRYYRQYYKVTNVVRKLVPEFNGFTTFRNNLHVGTEDAPLFDWLKSEHMTLENFLTDKNIIVIVDGDEYNIWQDMKKIGVINTNSIKKEISQ